MKYKTLLVLSFITVSLTVFAASHKEAQKSSLKDIRSQISKQKASIKAATGNKIKMAAQLQKAQADLENQRGVVSKMNLQYKALKYKQGLLEQKADSLTRKQAELIKTIKASNTYLASSGESEILEAILLSDNVNEVTAASQIVAQVNSKLYASVTELRKNTEELNATTKRMEQQKQYIASAMENKKTALKNYEAKKQSTAELYGKAVKDEKVRMAYMDLLKKKEKEIQARIVSIQKAFAKKAKAKPVFKGLPPQPPQGFNQYKGKLIWPVQGHIIERFGVKHVEGFSGVIMKKGIKIVPSSSSVKCVYDGVVIHIDNAWGLGNFLIVAHPSGFYTLYANMDGINVRNGENVRTGTVLGTIDVDRDTNTPYLYFEIRLRDRAVDPLQWLAGS